MYDHECRSKGSNTVYASTCASSTVLYYIISISVCANTFVTAFAKSVKILEVMFSDVEA